MLPVFVISIKGSERRPYITTLFAQCGIRFTFWDAVVGYDLSDAEKVTLYDATVISNQANVWHHSERHSTNAEIGCALSHRQIYQHMVATGIKEALIFEDDVIINQDVLAFIKIRRQLIPDDAELLLLGNSNDYVHHLFLHRFIWFLFARKTPFRRELKKFSKSNTISLIPSLLNKVLAFCFSSKFFYNTVRICKFYNVAYGAFAYYITHSGAQKLLDVQSPKIRYTSDVVTGDVIIGGHTLYILYPSLCLYNKTFASEIDRLDQSNGACYRYSTDSVAASKAPSIIRMWLGAIARILAICFPKTRPMLYTLRDTLRKALYKKPVRSTL